MSSSRPRMGVSHLVAVATMLAFVTPVLGTQMPRSGASFALLVGCTVYPDSKRMVPELFGPTNDVSTWSKLLTDPNGFAFPRANVTLLIGWPDNHTLRPTRANIVAGFESITAKVGPGDRVFILLSGHGTQVPIPEGQDPLDEDNFEPDGMDEVFLPADVRYGANRLENHILDNEVGGWLDRLRDKGADVLIVFDCCHSGTMTRVVADVERSRSVRPQALGIPDKQITDATARASAARQQTARVGRNLDAEAAKLRPAKDPKGRGSLVAVYAAQPFETAPELPLPEGVAHVRKNYYGLLSFTLTETLSQIKSPMTYRELSQVLAARYKAARGGRGPSAYFEGDLDREVLGYRTWPMRPSITLRVGPMMPVTVDAGHLRGVTPGSVLAVHPPAGQGDEKTVMAYLKVESADPYAAVVAPCPFAGKPAVNPAALKDLSRCSLASRSFGDLRVRLSVEPEVRPAFDDLAKLGDDGLEVQGMFFPPHTVSETQSEWALRRVDPQQAAESYGIAGLKGDHILLVPGEGRRKDPAEEKALVERLRASGKPVPRRAFTAYPVPVGKDDKSICEYLSRDLPKVFRWQSLWRVCSGLAGESAGDNYGVKFEIARAGGPPIRAGEALRVGTALEFRITNGPENVWVVAVYLDCDLGIEVYRVLSLAANATGRLPNAKVTGSPQSYGTEGMVLFVLPQRVQPTEPNFRFLEQRPLTRSEARKRGSDSYPQTPFGELMRSATLGGGGTRMLEKDEPTTPSAIIQTWYVTP